MKPPNLRMPPVSNGIGYRTGGGCGSNRDPGGLIDDFGIHLISAAKLSYEPGPPHPLPDPASETRRKPAAIMSGSAVAAPTDIRTPSANPDSHGYRKSSSRTSSSTPMP